jgi:hypothetical protein
MPASWPATIGDILALRQTWGAARHINSKTLPTEHQRPRTPQMLPGVAQCP